MRNSYLLYILIDKCHGILFFTYTYRYFSYDILSTRGIMTLYGLLCHSPIINSVFFGSMILPRRLTRATLKDRATCTLPMNNETVN